MALPTRVHAGQITIRSSSAQREFDTLLNRFFGGRESDGGGSTSRRTRVDVREDADHIYVEAELPGFKKDEVDITLENQTLTIAAERSERTQRRRTAAEGRACCCTSGVTRRFLRSFTLPPTVDEQSVNAKLTDGVLTITLNKREETKPRKVQVERKAARRTVMLNAEAITRVLRADPASRIPRS